jgi:predicted deacylase
MARQHAGETSGSWVLDGFLRAAAKDGDGPLIWAVPLADIDGVSEGRYGKDQFPRDFNRAWPLNCQPFRHETLCLSRDINHWRTRCRPVLALDFHSPGGTQTDGVYAYVPKPERFLAMHEQAVAWGRAFAEALGSYAAPDFCKLARYMSRWEAPSFPLYAAGALSIPALTIETPYAMAGDQVLTRDDYRAIGRRMYNVVAARIASHEGVAGIS